MKSCCAVGCANRYSKGVEIHFYRFPSDEQKIALWVARTGFLHSICGYVAHTSSMAKRAMHSSLIMLLSFATCVKGL